MASADNAHDPEWRLESVSWDADTMEASTKDTSSGGRAGGSVAANRAPNTSCQVRASWPPLLGFGRFMLVVMLSCIHSCRKAAWRSQKMPSSLPCPTRRPMTHQVEGCTAFLPLRSYYQRQHICGELGVACSSFPLPL